MKIKNFALVLLAIVIPAAALLPLPDFWIVQLNYIGLYALVCLGLVLLTGVAGLTSARRPLWGLARTRRHG